jgi:hypothetical protein
VNASTVRSRRKTPAVNTRQPFVGIDAAGNATVLYHRYVDADHLPLFTRRFSPGTGWSAAFLLADNVPEQVGLAVSRSGDALAHFVNSTVTEGRVVRFTPAGGWALASALVTTGESLVSPSIVFAPSGNAHMASGYGGIVARELDASTGMWSAPIAISLPPNGFAAYGPHIGVEGSGEPMVIWTEPTGGGVYRSFSRRRVAGSWVPAIPATSPNAGDGIQAMTVHSSGQALAIFGGVLRATWFR